MREQAPAKYWVDLYLNDDLSAEDVEVFETALLESRELQEAVETAMALREASARTLPDHEDAGSMPQSPNLLQPDSANWHWLALAASVFLAVVSTVMWWKTGNQAGDLERQVHELSRPWAEVLTVDVPIMRSAGSQSPDVIIQKPEGRAAILLDIELGLQAREQEQLSFALVDAEGASVLSWQSAPTANGRATAVIPSAQIPASLLWLEISTADGVTLERRLLEFRS